MAGARRRIQNMYDTTPLMPIGGVESEDVWPKKGDDKALALQPTHYVVGKFGNRRVFGSSDVNYTSLTSSKQVYPRLHLDLNTDNVMLSYKNEEAV